MTSAIDFGGWLRQRRRELDLTQADLAERVGCSTITIRKLEAGLRVPSRQMATLLADVLLLTADERAHFVAAARGRTTAAALPRRATIPTPLTPLLGREQEAAELSALLSDPAVRLVTILGPPGIGKTRLSLHLAALFAAEQYQLFEAIAFVPLAAVQDAALVGVAIARALAIACRDGDSLDAVSEHIGNAAVLLLLDNCEHVLDVAPDLARLLRMCARVKVLATSRAALKILGEHSFVLGPLALPGPQQSDLAAIASSPAVMLFVERARAVAPRFALRKSNAAAVAAICARVDGMPLAIELVAVRCRLLSPMELLARLDHRLALLNDGPRDLPPRHRTLRDAINWSYRLLSLSEQALFCALAACAGGCDFQAIAAISGLESTALIERLAVLLDNSMLVVHTSEQQVTRYSMLETLREFGLEQATFAGTLTALQAAHAAYYLALMRSAASELHKEYQEQWLLRLHHEYANLRAALDWAILHDPVTGLHAAALLQSFWTTRDYLAEGRSYLTRLLDACDNCPGALRAQALHCATHLAYEQGERPDAQHYATQTLALYREIDDTRGIAAALHNLARVAYGRADYNSARSYCEECEARYREIEDSDAIANVRQLRALIAKDQGDFALATALLQESLHQHRAQRNRRAEGYTLLNLSICAYWQGQFCAARELAEQSLLLLDEIGDVLGMAYSLDELGMAAARDGDLASGEQMLLESLAHFERLGDKSGSALALYDLGMLMMLVGDCERAAGYQQRGLSLAQSIGEQRRIAFCLEGLALALTQRDAWLAARLLGAAAALRVMIDTPHLPAERADYERGIAILRHLLGEHDFAAAWNLGSSMPIKTTIEVAGR